MAGAKVEQPEGRRQLANNKATRSEMPKQKQTACLPGNKRYETNRKQTQTQTKRQPQKAGYETSALN